LVADVVRGDTRVNIYDIVAGSCRRMCNDAPLELDAIGRDCSGGRCCRGAVVGGVDRRRLAHTRRVELAGVCDGIPRN
jgi:hypothetical protein